MDGRIDSCLTAALNFTSIISGVRSIGDGFSSSTGDYPQRGATPPSKFGQCRGTRSSRP